MAIIDKPSDHFETVLYTGNGGTNSISSLDFQPDWVWIKYRNSSTYGHDLYDAIRTAGKVLNTNTTGAQYTETDRLTAFTSDGFNLGGSASVNENSGTYVSWNWKANGAGSANTAGSINSSVSVNTTAGFSIVSYTGNGTGNSTVGHGLGATPKFIIVKNLTTAQDWGTYSPSFVSASDPNVLYLSKNSAQVDDTNVWGTSAVFNNNTFTVGDWVGSNQSGSNFIAYCFNDVQGFSKMGSYTGNGSTNGTFIYTGFKPAFVMIKSSSSAQSWSILDIKRDVNPNAKVLWPNDNFAEYDETQGVDFLSNGFKNRESGDGFNGSGATYIYMAFAENPFTSSAGTPVTAR